MKTVKTIRKLCECGCSQLVPLATKTDSSTNRIKGQPMRFIRGHNNYGRKRPDLSARNRTWQNERNPQWKGDQTKPLSKHIWLNSHYPRKGICERCGRQAKTDYAFKNHDLPYTRKRDDYEELCRSCHMLKDHKTKPVDWDEIEKEEKK